MREELFQALPAASLPRFFPAQRAAAGDEGTQFSLRTAALPSACLKHGAGKKNTGFSRGDHVKKTKLPSADLASQSTLCLPVFVSRNGANYNLV